MSETRWKCEARAYQDGDCDDVYCVELMDEQDIYFADVYGDTEKQALAIAAKIVREHNFVADLLRAESTGDALDLITDYHATVTP